MGKDLIHDLKCFKKRFGLFCSGSQIINAKDFGVPQNRERVFIVGFHPDTEVTKFRYPKPTKRIVKFADIKEKEIVPTKYYLSTQYLTTLEAHKTRHESKGNGFGYAIIRRRHSKRHCCWRDGTREKSWYDHRITDFTPTTH